MPTDLFQMEFDEISLVPSGDNPEAHIVMFKADPSNPDIAVTSAHAFVPMAGKADCCETCGGSASDKHHKTMFGKDDGTLVEPTMEDLDAAIEAWDSVPEEARADAMEQLLQVAEDLDADEDTINSITSLPMSKDNGGSPTRMKKKGGKVDTLTNEEKAIIDALPSEAQDLFKALVNESSAADEDEFIDTLLEKSDPAVRLIIEKSRQETAEALSIAKAAQVEAQTERELRVHREFIAKADGFKNLTGTVEEKAEILKAAYAVSNENGMKVEQMMLAANAQLDDAGLFTQFGKQAPGATPGAAQEVEARAAEMRKSDPTLTIEQARAKVYESDKSLFDRVQEEK